MAEKSMLERVSRELCRNDGHEENIRFEGAPMWRSYVDQARKVIACMRDPTDAMMPRDGVPAGVSGGSDHYVDRDEARCVWQAMIDLALSEI